MLKGNVQAWVLNDDALRRVLGMMSHRKSTEQMLHKGSHELHLARSSFWLWTLAKFWYMTIDKSFYFCAIAIVKLHSSNKIFSNPHFRYYFLVGCKRRKPTDFFEQFTGMSTRQSLEQGMSLRPAWFSIAWYTIVLAPYQTGCQRQDGRPISGQVVWVSSPKNYLKIWVSTSPSPMIP